MAEDCRLVPPPGLVDKWRNDWDRAKVKHLSTYAFIATQAARWGADRELEACCEDILELIAGIYSDRVIEDWSEFVALLRDGRRPTEAALALDAFDRLQAGNGTDDDWRIVRQKLEKDCDD